MRIIVVFENRTSTLLFSRDLRALHIPSMIVNTPRGIATSCGISVELDERFLKTVYALVTKNKYTLFKGVNRVVRYSMGTRYIKL